MSTDSRSVRTRKTRWLQTGEGEIFVTLTKSQEITDFAGEILKNDDNFKLRLISVLARLDEPEWKVIEKLALKLAAEEAKKD